LSLQANGEDQCGQNGRNCHLEKNLNFIHIMWTNFGTFLGQNFNTIKIMGFLPMYTNGSKIVIFGTFWSFYQEFLATLQQTRVIRCHGAVARWSSKLPFDSKITGLNLAWAWFSEAGSYNRRGSQGDYLHILGDFFKNSSGNPGGSG
jgi:hypothetical protein